MTNNDVYFDAKAVIEQRLKEVEAKTKEADEEKERLKNIEMGAAVVGSITRFFVAPVILMLVWNVTMPALGVVNLGYFTAVGLYVIARILFSHE